MHSPMNRLTVRFRIPFFIAYHRSFLLRNGAPSAFCFVFVSCENLLAAFVNQEINTIIYYSLKSMQQSSIFDKINKSIPLPDDRRKILEIIHKSKNAQFHTIRIQLFRSVRSKHTLLQGTCRLHAIIRYIYAPDETTGKTGLRNRNPVLLFIWYSRYPCTILRRQNPPAHSRFPVPCSR